MPSLREMQLRFAGALFAEVESQAFGLLAGEPLAAAAGVAVYRNNLREGFRKALALEFPVVEQLVGSDYFRQLALEFLAAHPSRSGDLYGIGAPFPAWLRERFAATEYAWFADVAALEWALEELRIAPAPAAATALDLAAVDPDRHADLRLRLHPAARLVTASVPAVDIWRAHQPPMTLDSIDLAAGGERTLVRATPAGFEFHRLGVGEHRLLETLARGGTLGTAVECALDAEPGLDLARALRRLFAAGAFILATE